MMLNTPRIDALIRLRPGAAWIWLDQDDYATIDWRDETQTLPTEEEIDAEVANGTPASKVMTVTPRQARLALLAAGLLPAVESAVDAAGGATKITWEYATEINRTDELITAIGSSLGLADADIDLLFEQAAAIT